MTLREFAQIFILVAASFMVFMFVCHSCASFCKYESKRKVPRVAQSYMSLFITVVIIFLFRMGFKS